MVDENILAESLWESAAEAFETTVMMDIERCQPDNAAENEAEAANCFISGSITFTGPLEGAVVLNCIDQTARALARSMMMMEEDEEIEEAEVQDALGEITNLLTGGLKSRLLDSVGDIEISVPTVVCGRNVKPSVGISSQKTCICAKAGDHPLCINLVYKGGGS